jgi:anti-anti-sigma factor
MKIAVSREKDVSVIALQGKLDSFSSRDFEEHLLALIAEGHTKLIIDCTQLEYVSSAGLRIFYLAANRLQALGGKMVFCAVNENIQRVFDIVDLSSDFLILPEREEALQQF